jgi:hypothetical protein
MRILTVSRKFRKGKGHWAKYRATVELCLVGKWMERAGFEAGDKVIVEVRENQLIITKQSPIFLTK